MESLRDELLIQQYISLREEIRETKDRTFKIAAIALFIFPAGEHVARVLGAKLLLLILPILVISVALLYLAENHALMRCGRYIRQGIEREMQGIIGWERWLETRDECKPRSVDRYVAYSIYIVLGVYYVAAVFVAVEYSNDTYGMLPSALFLGFYSAVGILFLYYLVRNVRLTTTTDSDCAKIDQTWQ